MPSHLPPPNPGRESPSEDRNGEEAPWENDSSQGDQPQLTSVRVGKGESYYGPSLDIPKEDRTRETKVDVSLTLPQLFSVSVNR